MSGPVPQLPPQFGKLVALWRSSTHEAERATARRKAEALLPPAAGGWDRALRILTYQEAKAKAGHMAFMAGFDEFTEIDSPGHMAREAERKAEKRRLQNVRRAELVAEFGSLQAALKPCPREKALIDAVKPWRVAAPGTRGRYTKTLAGIGGDDRRKAPSDLTAAIKGALPMPTTYGEAIAEVDYWTRRNDDMELAATADGSPFYGNEMLDTPAVWRWRMIQDLAEHEMPLRTLPEVLARMKAYRWNEMGTVVEIEDALIRDVEALVAGADDESLTLAVRRAVAPMNGCEDDSNDHRACVAPCQCMRVAREVMALCAARVAAT